jgi:hypothetical protein
MACISLDGFLDQTGDVSKDGQIFMCGYAGWGGTGDGPLDEFVKRWEYEKGLVATGSNYALDLLSHSGEILGRDADKVDLLTERLVDAIRGTIPIGIAVGFDAKHYRTLTPNHQNWIGHPLLVCMSRAIDLVVDFSNELRARGDEIDGINLTFGDSEKKAADMLRTWIRLKKARPQLIDAVASVGLADEKHFHALQAVGLLTNLTHRYWQPNLANKALSSDRTERHLRKLLTPDPALQFVYRVRFVTAAEMNAAVRKHKRLYGDDEIVPSKDKRS